MVNSMVHSMVHSICWVFFFVCFILSLRMLSCKLCGGLGMFSAIFIFLEIGTEVVDHYFCWQIKVSRAPWVGL